MDRSIRGCKARISNPKKGINKTLINYLNVGVLDIGEARKFFNGLVSSQRYDCLSSGEGFVTYGQDRNELRS